eukprot:1158689-Pelagomonas_calceolata.AAC.21
MEAMSGTIDRRDTLGGVKLTHPTAWAYQHSELAECEPLTAHSQFRPDNYNTIRSDPPALHTQQKAASGLPRMLAFDAFDAHLRQH